MTPARDVELSARIDDELRRALAATPSPEFLPRVRARVAGSPASSRGVLSSWLAPAGLAAAAMLLIALQFRPDTPPAPLPSTPAPHPAPTVRLAPTRHPAPLGHSASRRTLRPARAPRDSMPPEAPRMPEVLVSPTDRIAFERFVAGLAQGRIDASAWAGDAAPAGPPARIAISPIDIRPLTPDR